MNIIISDIDIDKELNLLYKFHELLLLSSISFRMEPMNFYRLDYLDTINHKIELGQNPKFDLCFRIISLD